MNRILEISHWCSGEIFQLRRGISASFSFTGQVFAHLISMDLVPPDLSDLTRRHFLEFTEAPGVLGIWGVWGVWGEVRAGAYGVDTFRIMEPLGISNIF